VILDTLQALPELLHSLLTGMDARARDFRHNICHWNDVFSFTRIPFNMNNRPIVQGAGVHVFQIHGNLYHLHGPLIPLRENDARYAQCYLFDPLCATQACSNHFEDLNQDIISQLSAMFHAHCLFAPVFKTV